MAPRRSIIERPFATRKARALQRGALDPVEYDVHLAALKDLLVAQARDLNRVFARAFADMLRGKTRSYRDVGRALKAQNQCRIAMNLLLALHAAELAAKNLAIERTSFWKRKIAIIIKRLDTPSSRALPARTRRAHKGLQRGS